MTEQSDFNSLYSSGMKTLTERLTEGDLERMRTSAIGGGSLSLGVILLSLQTKLDDGALIVALYASVFAIPFWIGAWQCVEAYMSCGKDSYGHFASPKGSLVAVSFALLGLTLLLVSVVSLIWHMSHIAAVIFFVASIVMAVFVFRQHNAVRKYADKVRSAQN